MSGDFLAVGIVDAIVVVAEDDTIRVDFPSVGGIRVRRK